MPREGIEVAIQSLHVDTAVHDTLASVHHGDRPHGMCRIDDGPQVGTRSERIRSLRNGDDAGLVIQQRRQQFGAQAPLVVEGQDADFRPLAFGEHLPGHDIGVVLHLADKDIVARTDELFTPGIGHRIERSRSAGRKDDLFLFGRADKSADTLACRLVKRRGLLRKVVHPAMYIGVESALQVIDHLDHGQRFLRRGSAVEVNQRLAVDLAPQDRELPAYFFNVEHRYDFSSLATTASIAASHSGSMPQRRTTSPTKPSICTLRAWASLRPRCRI